MQMQTNEWHTMLQLVELCQNGEQISSVYFIGSGIWEAFICDF
jgi:dolichyl-phosphate-mannose--protein O-mannosyl transferase